MRWIRDCFVLFAFSPFAALAGSGDAGDDGRDSRWTLGIGASARAPLYLGEKGLRFAFPFVDYQGDRVYFSGDALGIRLLDREHLSINVFVAAHAEGMDAEDLSRSELAVRGIDRNSLDDREFGADAGVSVAWRGIAGEFVADARTDVSGVSKGHQASLDYRYPFKIGRTALIPGIGATLLSKNVANYYYGISSKEIARGIVAYRPGEVVVPHAGLAVAVELNERWSLFSGARVDAFPNEIRASPIIDEDADVVPSAFVAVARRF
ncbi:MAG: MipA/OmpV family protein [Xanthomonadaceae bacterium]|nr:MipA/OmpV family protein [Xanthomonadaceae bacterium]